MAHRPRSLALTACTLAAAAGAVAILATQLDRQLLDYGVGIVPVVVPSLAACLSAALAVLARDGRRVSSPAGEALVGAVVVLGAWSLAMLPFDALRIVGLVPLPLSPWGLALRLLLLVAVATSIRPALRAQQARRARCTGCGRTVPGRLDALPRWPVLAGLVAAFVYPVLRVVWAMGGTFGTSGHALEMDPALAWGVVVVGSALPALVAFLLRDRGPVAARTVVGLGGLLAGLGLAVVGGLGAADATSRLLAEGLSSAQGDGVMTWTFVLVYGSWFVAGVGVLVGSWRYWAHRRDDCAECRGVLGR
jgi:hypothetical protein